MTRDGYSRTPPSAASLSRSSGGSCSCGAGQKLVDLVEELERRGDGRALHALGHQRRRSDGDRAARALKADVFDLSVAELDVQRHLVAAERIHACDDASRRRLARRSCADCGCDRGSLRDTALEAHPRKISTALLSPAISRSTSSSIVVERERRARRRGDAETFHDRHRAVMARADGDALAVDDRAEVVGVDAVDDERQHARLVAAPCRSAAAPGTSASDALRRALEQRVLVRRRARRSRWLRGSRSAAPRPTTPVMFGVPASNL